MFDRDILTALIIKSLKISNCAFDMTSKESHYETFVWYLPALTLLILGSNGKGSTIILSSF